MYVVCLEHLEEALDEFVEDYGTAPDVHLLEAARFADWTPPGRCRYCERGPVYLVV